MNKSILDNAIGHLKEHVRLIEYEDEISEVMKADVEKPKPGGGYEPPASGDLPEEGKRILSKVYSKCRSDGGDKEKCAKIAWTATRNAGFASGSYAKKLWKAQELLFDLVNRVKKQGELAPIPEARAMPTQNYISSLNYPVFLMEFPTNVSNEAPNNAWMKDKNLQEFDYDKAYRQWLDLYGVLNSGAMVYVLPSEEGLQDQVYTANAGIALPDHVEKNTIILSNFRSKPRTGEEGAGRQFFNQMQFNVVQPPAFFEGEADLKYIRDDVFVGGYGIRTQPETYAWMQDNYDMQVVMVKMTDQLLYHFDCLLFPITNEDALVSVDALSPEDVKNIESVVNIIPVPHELIYTGITNVVRVGNIAINSSDIMTIGKDDPTYKQEVEKVEFFTETMSKFNIEPVFVNIGEFDKSGADISCMVMHLNYFDYIQNISNAENSLQKAWQLSSGKWHDYDRNGNVIEVKAPGKDKKPDGKGEQPKRNFKEYSPEEHEKAISQLTKLDTKELRRKQDLVADQQKNAIELLKSPTEKERAKHGLENLSVMEDHLQAAIDIKEFKDFTPKQWAKKIYEKHNK